MNPMQRLQRIESAILARSKRRPKYNIDRLGDIGLHRIPHLLRKARAMGFDTFSENELAEWRLLSDAIQPGSVSPVPAERAWERDLSELVDRVGANVWYANQNLRPQPALIDGEYRLAPEDAALIVQYVKLDAAGRKQLVEDHDAAQQFPMKDAIGFCLGMGRR